jgi:DNA-binding HxlR family transcriptional regulator
MKRVRQQCPAEVTLRVIGGSWKIPIVYHLRETARRFSDLQRTLETVSQKVLTQQLRELEAAGVVSRKVYAEVPPRVEYSLTDFGRTLEPVVCAMVSWGKAHSRRIGGAEPACLKKREAAR